MEDWVYFIIELAAVAFGFASVWLTVRQNVWCWPLGIAQVSLFIIIFYHARLYSDLILHVIYVFLGFYGWWKWTRKTDGTEDLRVIRLGHLKLAAWTATGCAGTVGLGYLMATRTNASFPYFDATITSFSLCAQALLSWKLLQSWLFWIGVDMLAIGVYLAKDLYPTAGLYLVFLALAVRGYFEWRKSMAEDLRKGRLAGNETGI